MNGNSAKVEVNKHRDIAGYQTYVPNIFVCDGRLTRDYNPTELIQEVGDIVEVREIIFAWLIATNEKGVTGWLPVEIVVSMDVTCKPNG